MYISLIETLFVDPLHLEHQLPNQPQPMGDCSWCIFDAAHIAVHEKPNSYNWMLGRFCTGGV